MNFNHVMFTYEIVTIFVTVFVTTFLLRNRAPLMFISSDERHDQHQTRFTEESAYLTAAATTPTAATAESVPKEPLAGHQPETAPRLPREATHRLPGGLVSRGTEW